MSGKDSAGSTEKEAQVCFVIAPIGEDGTEVRTRSDQVLNHVIAPAAKECGYDTVRADKISEPGMITSQVIQHLLEDPLVVADLTGRNANVFYELAIRHAVRKPMVQLIQQGDPIPFDVAQSRTIQVDHHDLDSVASCKTELIKQIHAVEKNPGDVDTPISQAVDLQALRQSENPLEKSNAEIIAMLQELRGAVGELAEINRYPARLHLIMFDQLTDAIDRIHLLADFDDGEEVTHQRLHEIQRVLRSLDQHLSQMAMDLGMPAAMIEDLVMRRKRRRR